MSTFVLVHGGWHTGEHLEAVAQPIRQAGHTVHCPTIAGNREGDDKTIGLKAAVSSIVDYLEDNDLRDVILLGHSYGGMVITGTADRCPERIRRLIYWSAFVPNDGEALIDLVPAHYAALFQQLADSSPDNSVILPFAIWRDGFINDATLAVAQAAYEKLNPHPFGTITEAISLTKNPAEMQIAKSFIHCTTDTALPQSNGWHPGMSEKLGLFRLVQVTGSHEICFTNPLALAKAIMDAGQD